MKSSEGGSSFANETNRHAAHILRAVYESLIGAGVSESTTLRELRVLNSLSVKLTTDSHVTHRQLVEACPYAPATTVSRFVGNWLEAGWISEEVSNADKRRREIKISDYGGSNSLKFSKALIESLGEVLRLAEREHSHDDGEDAEKDQVHHDSLESDGEELEGEDCENPTQGRKEGLHE